MSLSDQELLQQYARDRSEPAFAALVQRHGSLVLGACWRIVGDRDEAEDAFQEAFVRLARCASLLCAQTERWTHLGPWLHRVATNVAVDRLREIRARRLREQSYANRRTSEQQKQVAWGHLLPLIDEEIRALPRQFREPVVLCYLQGIQQRAAAEQLGISFAMIRRRLQKAKSMLKDRFARRGLIASFFLLHVLMDRLSAAATVSPSQIVLAVSKVNMPGVAEVNPLNLSSAVSHALAVANRLWKMRRVRRLGVLAVAILLPILALSVFHFRQGPSAPREVVESDASVRRAVVDVEAASTPDLMPVEAKRDDVEEPDVLDEIPPLLEGNEEEIVAEDDFRDEDDIRANDDIVIRWTLDSSKLGIDPTANSPDGFGRPRYPKFEEAETTDVSVQELFGILWHTDLDGALRNANAEGPKPVLCFRVLGELSGFM